MPGSCYIASNATVIGDVEFGEQCSAWFQSVIRGDNDRIVIGARTNIQDGAVVHTDQGIPVMIGEDVSIGHHAIVHGCRIGRGCLIGINAVILNHAELGEDCLVGAGSVVTEGKKIPPRSLVLGVPGKVVRQLTDDDIERLREAARHYVEKITLYRQAHTKS